MRIYARDPASVDYELPIAVVYAESREDVVEVVRLAVERRFYITPVFHSTSLSGNAATATRQTVVVSFEL